jgi:hypothetical protein
MKGMRVSRASSVDTNILPKSGDLPSASIKNKITSGGEIGFDIAPGLL